MQIRLTAGGAQAVARLYDTSTARDFASLLPLTISLHDLGGREKAGPLPRPLADGRGQDSYRAGQLGYWSPSHDLAVYCHQDGFQIPPPGIVIIGDDQRRPGRHRRRRRQRRGDHHRRGPPGPAVTSRVRRRKPAAQLYITRKDIVL